MPIKAEVLTADQLAVVGSMALMREKKQLAKGDQSFAIPTSSVMAGIRSGYRSSASWGFDSEANKLQRLAAYTGYVHTVYSARAVRDAKAKYMLYDSRDPSAPVPEEKLPVPYSFFRHPNPVMSEYQLSVLVRLWLMFTGTAPILVIRNSIGIPVMQWPLLPSRVRRLYADNDLWCRYEYTDDSGRVREIPAADMIYIVNPHPTKIFDGLGDVEGTIVSHETNQLLWRFQRQLFESGPFSSWILQYPENVRLGDTARPIADAFEEIVSDRDHPAYPVVLDQGVEAKAFPVTNKGLNVPELTEKMEAHIRSSVCVSKAILGEVEMGSRANVEGADAMFFQMSGAYNRMISDGYGAALFGSSLVPEQKKWDERLFGAHEDLAPRDKAFALTQAQAMVSGGAMTVNEWRGEAGLEPIEGGDTLAGQVAAAPDGAGDDDQDAPAPEVPASADVQATALNGAQVDSLAGIIDKVTAGAMSRETAAAFIAIAFPTVTAEQIAALLAGIVVKEPIEEPPSPPAKPPKTDDEEDDQGEDKSASLSKSVRMAADPAAVRLAKSKAFIAFQGKHEAKILAALQPILAAERDAIIARVEKYAPKALTMIAGCASKKTARVVLADSPEVKKIADDMEEFAAEYQKLTPDLGALYTEAGKRAASEFGVIFHVDKRGLTKIANHLHKSTDSILKTTSKQIRAALEEGFLEGEGVEALSQRIRDLYDGISKGRALTIARTETVAPANDGAMQGYKQAGVDKEWIATKDEHTRDSHVALDGVVIGIDEEFKVGNDKMLYPGGGEDPGENIN